MPYSLRLTETADEHYSPTGDESFFARMTVGSAVMRMITAIGAIMLLGLQFNAHAQEIGDSGEQDFLAMTGDAAVLVEPGVYDIFRNDGSKGRYTFGLDGLKHDLAVFTARLSSKKKSGGNTPSLRFFENLVANLEEQKASMMARSKGTVSGTICSTWSFDMTADFVPGPIGGTTHASSSLQNATPPIAGPASPYHDAEVHAFALAASTSGVEFETWADAAGVDAASVSVATNCGTNQACGFWEAHMVTRVVGCYYRGYNPSGGL